MYWPSEVIEKIQRDVVPPFHVDDMKTPSGQIHIGSLRGVIIHDVIHKELLKRGLESRYTYIYNDMDPMNKVPVYLSGLGYENDLGKPLFKIKSPEGKLNYAQFYANIFTGVFNVLGAHPEVIFSSDLYSAGKFNSTIRESLDKVKYIRKIYTDIAGYEKPEGWYPLQVICPNCGKVGTSLVTSWDGDKVDFECKEDLVSWAKGCGHKGRISPFDGNAKLMWKVDWPAHWKVLGVNIEGAGKDHTSAGGSRDIANQLCGLFNIPVPLDVPYEWFLTKEGGKMSTSKGIGMYAKELIEVLPPEVARFLILRTHYNTAILFDPNGETFLDLFDEFDRCAKFFYEKDDKNVDLAQYFEAGIIRDEFRTPTFLPRFRSIAMYVQMPSVDIYNWAATEKGSDLTTFEKLVLEERVYSARQWLNKYAPEEFKFSFQEIIPELCSGLSHEQLLFLEELLILLESKYLKNAVSGEDLQQEIFEVAKKIGLSGKAAFEALYIILLGKTNGPRAAWLLLDIGIEKVVERINSVVAKFSPKSV